MYENNSENLLILQKKNMRNKRLICMIVSMLVYACNNDYYDDFFSWG